VYYLDVANQKSRGLYYGQQFQSEGVDDKLFKFVRLTQTALIELRRFQPSDLTILEIAVKGSFFYEVTNKRTRRLAYFGRDLTSGEVTFLLHDGGRILWSRLEGFYEEWTPEVHEWVYKNIGVLRKLASINDFISFLGGSKEYSCVGEYIKS
jgi:hypothetical protein